MSAPILEVRDVHKVYGGVRALNGLSLSVAAGEIHCVVGPNGAGKSTFFKTLIGVERPTTGQVFYKGQEVTKLPAFRRARLGLSVKFQNISAFGELTALQNLFVPLRRNHRKADIPARASAVLARVGLAGVEDTPVRQLSHGQQQWLSIGLSIAAEPDLLLLDEPAAGLSSEETARTAELIRELNRSGMTVVVIEHDMGFIRSLRARTSVLHYGRLFAQGGFDEIATNEDVRRIYLGAA
ncbi:branched-chain amino acid transport system ATP-binding protein [Methylopila capsulata]|uniref:ABC transporter ATP-binding protein n=1 Tax=Methylopila capsulata TaxID=61654 RepID=A0A9W6MSR8_9HYPH|nr:ABC transporter ATP-binding protein [Methylopila capsulata]MBM7852354.1 branched-chain amino acid transport system ATP-binding protein [Methylopila capsulata]GLK56564.1 ABC transporter ATP-binding protein [Methylopila capsulata]